MTIQRWLLSRLEAVKDNSHIIIKDPLRLLPEADSTIHTFAIENRFTVIVAATNLVFRELYEHTLADLEVKKLLILDRAPIGRIKEKSIMKAPPPFYPDLLANTKEEARLNLDLCQFLKETTGDEHWHPEANNPQFARLIMKNLDAVLRAHQNLRNSDPKRFTDSDFKTIVAYSALGIADAAFKKLDAEDYWKIGLIGHTAIEELDSLAPDITKPIKSQLEKAPAPFCWFAQYDPSTVIRAFYLSLILAQHTDDWSLLIANIDPALKSLSKIEPKLLNDSAPKLIALNPVQANRDIAEVEQSLDKEALQLVLVEQLKIAEPNNFVSIIQKERYSSLIRSLSLLLALDNLISSKPDNQAHKRIEEVIFSKGDTKERVFAEDRGAIYWSDIKEAYSLAYKVQHLRGELTDFLKNLKMMPINALSFKLFWEMWNTKKINRLEYYLSALQRIIQSGNLLPCAENNLPSLFTNSLHRIQQTVRTMSESVYRQIDELNTCFQKMVALQYPSWIQKDSEVCLTSQFIRRCLKPHWDPLTERAVLFIFDGMRYDIWDEFLKPMLSDKMQIIANIPASSLLPSETHITRKAICAGTYPDEFDTTKGEDKLLKDALNKEIGFKGEVRVVPPKGGGVGETVRYQAGNLDIYILELCDSELHKIKTKQLSDGSMVPERPLSFIYKQHIQNIIDTEIMAIVRDLPANTKVFVTADHGFVRVSREFLWFNEQELNEPEDCNYLNCRLRSPVDRYMPAKVRDNIIAFSPEQLRMPKEETRTDRKTGRLINKQYSAIVFAKVGYAFKRPNSHFNPDAYSHGGISIQEMMIPMVVMKVRTNDEGLLRIDEIMGPNEIVEGEEIGFTIRLSKVLSKSLLDEDIRVDVEASYSGEIEDKALPNQVVYVSDKGTDVSFRFVPLCDEATPQERKQGWMERILTITISYQDDRRMLRQVRTKRFKVQLNPEKIIRRVGNLGSILGLTPRGMG